MANELDPRIAEIIPPPEKEPTLDPRIESIIPPKQEEAAPQFTPEGVDDRIASVGPAPEQPFDDRITSIRTPDERGRPSFTEVAKGAGSMLFQREIKTLQGAEKLSKFVFKEGFQDPAKAAPIVREYLSDLVSSSPAEIEAEAQRTGKINFPKIAGRVAAESISELIPMTPTDVALIGLIGAGGKAIGTAFPTVARVAKTPISRLAGRARAIKRFGGRGPQLVGPTGGPTAPPVRPRPVIRPGEVPEPTKPILTKPPQQISGGPIVSPEELSKVPPHLRKDFLSPVDTTKPISAQMADSLKLSKPEANDVEAIIPTEGPLILTAEQEAKVGPGVTIQRELVDRFTPIKGTPTKGISPEFEQAGGRYSKAYVTARLLKGKIRGKAELLLDQVNTVVQPLKSHKERLWLNELYSMKNFRDLDRIGRTTSGISEEVANIRLGNLRRKIGDENFKRIEGVADRLANLQNNDALEILIEAKMITPKTANELKARFPNYLRSEILDENLSHKYPHFIASGGEAVGRINRSFLKNKKGTTQVINTDVLDVIRRSLVSKVAAAEKQRVVDQVAKEFGVEVGKTVDAGKLVTIVDPKQIPPGFKQSNARASGGRIFAVQEEVERILQGLNTQEADLVTKAMSHYNNFFRVAATTYRLPFVVNNIARDVQTMLFNRRVVPQSKTLPVAATEGAITALKAGFNVKNETFKQFLRSGAAFGGLVTSVPKNIKVPFRLRPPGEKLADVTKRVVGLPLEEVGRLAQISENFPRLTEFIRLKGTRLPPELKALNARDITVDFEKMGDAMKLANRWIPFLNAQVQGELNTVRAIKDQPVRSIGRLATLIATPTVGLYAWNRQFKNNDVIDPFIKENFFYVNTGASIEREGLNVPILLLAKKGEAARHMSAPIEIALEWFENDPGFASRMDQYNVANIGSSMISRLVPPLVSGVAEQFANYSFFRRRPVVPQRLQNVESGSQFTTFTSNTARLIGERTGLSPVRLEHGARSFVPLAPQGFEISDIALKTLGSKFPELKPFVTPTVPRRPREKLRAAEAFFPTVRAPSGFFSPEKFAAGKFLEEKQKEERTPRFLFQEAFSSFLRDKTPENRQRMLGLAKAVRGDHRARIMKQEILRFKRSQLDQRNKAIRRLPRRLQPEFTRELEGQGL